MDIRKVEVAVRKVERFEVVRCELTTHGDGTCSGGSESFGEFRDERKANEVADMVQKIEASGLLPAENSVGLDSGQSAPILEALAERGVDGGLLCGIRQGGGLRGPIWNMELKLKARQVAHGGRPLLNWIVGNAKATRVGSMVVIEKVQQGVAKIDPLIAILNAAELMGRNPVADGGKVLSVGADYSVG